MGLHPSDIVSGYERAHKATVKLLETMECERITDFRNKQAILPVIESAMCPKLPNYYKYFSDDACL